MLVLPEYSCYVFKCNMIGRYIDRLNTALLGGIYKMLDTLFDSKFIAHYYVLHKETIDPVNDS